jgi:glutamine cyclotransferase
MKVLAALFAILIPTLPVGVNREPHGEHRIVPTWHVHVIHTYPHDANAYTQGLICRDGFLYESTGLNGRSSLRKVELETGRVIQQRDVASNYFAEGLTDWRDRLIQLTWRSHVGFAYDISSFSLRDTFALPGEGWGLAHDADSLIVSDGSPTLRFLHPDTFREVRRVDVTERGTPVRELNELEMVKGQLFANVWHTNRIAIISPSDGQVAGWVDLTGLMSVGYKLDAEAVLNGIAYDAGHQRLFVTGKLWPRLFEIQLLR